MYDTVLNYKRDYYIMLMDQVFKFPIKLLIEFLEDILKGRAEIQDIYKRGRFCKSYSEIESDWSITDADIEEIKHELSVIQERFTEVHNKYRENLYFMKRLHNYGINFPYMNDKLYLELESKGYSQVASEITLSSALCLRNELIYDGKKARIISVSNAIIGKRDYKVYARN